MASSKKARDIKLPLFENTLSLDTGDFSGLSTTSSASFGKRSYGLNMLDDGFSVSTGFRSPRKPRFVDVPSA